MDKKTITRAELIRLSQLNSKDLPKAISNRGKRMEFVGFGWIDCGKPLGDEVILIDTPRLIPS